MTVASAFYLHMPQAAEDVAIAGLAETLDKGGQEALKHLSDDIFQVFGATHKTKQPE